MKKQEVVLGFGKRLASLRKQCGMSQTELAKHIRTTRRTIVYYETEANNLPARFVKPLAEVLNVSVEELLGIKVVKNELTKEEIALWRRFKKLKNLPVRDQKTVYSLIHALISKYQSKNGSN